MQICYLEEKQRQTLSDYFPLWLQEPRSPGQLFYAAVDEGTAVGVLAAQVMVPRVELLWVSVADDRRRKGVGRRLIDALVRDVWGISSITELCAQVTEESPIAGLLSRCGFSLEPVPTGTYSLTLSQLNRSSNGFWEKELSHEQIHPLADAPRDLLKEYNRMLARRDDVPFDLPLAPGDYDPALSLYYRSDDAIIGVLLMQSQEDGLYLSALYTECDEPSPLAAAALLHAAADKARELYPPDTRINLAAITPVSAALTEKLLPALSRSNGLLAHHMINA